MFGSFGYIYTHTHIYPAVILNHVWDLTPLILEIPPSSNTMNNLVEVVQNNPTMMFIIGVSYDPVSNKLRTITLW